MHQILDRSFNFRFKYSRGSSYSLRGVIPFQGIITLGSYNSPANSNWGQKQPFRGVLKKRSSQKFHKIHRKALVPESLFNKVAGLPLSYRNQSIDLLSKSMDWFLYDNGTPATLLKRDSGTGVFLLILRNF